jgi:hypothetical protein
MEQAASFQDPIDDSGSEVVVVKDRAPRIRMLVRGEDHRALRLMALGDHVIEDVRGIVAVRQVADFVDDEHVRHDVSP